MWGKSEESWKIKFLPIPQGKSDIVPEEKKKKSRQKITEKEQSPIENPMWGKSEESWKIKFLPIPQGKSDIVPEEKKKKSRQKIIE